VTVDEITGSTLPSRSAVRELGAFGPLLGLTAINISLASMYVATGKPPDEFLSFAGRIQLLFVIYWVLLDARRRRQIPCHDFGFLMAVFLPVSLGWYLIWTRGLKGLLLLGLFATLIIAPAFCAMIVGTMK
jgi:hypothetical protein